MALASAHHLGRIGHFAEMAVAQGLVSIHFVNVLSRPVVAPWGGGDGRFGTNPCCIGVPLAGARALRARLRDQPRGAGQDARGPQRGQARPNPATLIDEDGRPTTDPGVVVVPQASGRSAR